MTGVQQLSKFDRVLSPSSTSPFIDDTKISSSSSSSPPFSLRHPTTLTKARDKINSDGKPDRRLLSNDANIESSSAIATLSTTLTSTTPRTQTLIQLSCQHAPCDFKVPILKGPEGRNLARQTWRSTKYREPGSHYRCKASLFDTPAPFGGSIHENYIISALSQRLMIDFGQGLLQTLLNSA